MQNTTKKKRIGSIVWAAIYLVLVGIFACSATLIFHSTYFSSIYVSGTSMSPTLLGGEGTDKANFGIIDTTDWARKNIKRFDIVTTYFPWDSNDYSEESRNNNDYSEADGPDPTYKIKRVIAFGGETIFYFTSNNQSNSFPLGLIDHIIILESRDDDGDGHDDGTGSIKAIFGDEAKTVIVNEISYKVKKLPFNRAISKDPMRPNPESKYGRSSIEPFAVPKGSYFVMGDNWSSQGRSVDSGYKETPIFFDNIVGVLVAIEGTCRITFDGGINKCVDRHYSWPVFY
ncbi:MAG: S26 family signal peptidase [Bacilli bacterium]|jgi:signal peptidase I|nr:S26 family signal peptidase [Bacilli bacterium]